MKVEVSRPHYHPSHETAKDLKLTKKRDLSVPPYWVANERIEKDGVSYAIIMPPRDKELYEIHQHAHIHMPKIVSLGINGRHVRATVKLEDADFNPVVHLDERGARAYGVEGEGETTL